MHLERFEFGGEREYIGVDKKTLLPLLSSWWPRLVARLVDILSDPWHQIFLKEEFGVSVQQDWEFCARVFDVLDDPVWVIIPDGLSYMPEVVGHYGSHALAQQNMITLHRVLSWAVGEAWWRLTTQQLEHLGILWVNDVDLVQPEPAKDEWYYPLVINPLIHRWSQFSQQDIDDIQAQRNEYCSDTPCPESLRLIRNHIKPEILYKWWFWSAVWTTWLHVHTSGHTITDTLDLFLDLLYREWQARREKWDKFYVDLLKSEKRHIAFGAIVSLRYRLSKKSESYLRNRYERQPGNEVDTSMQPDASWNLSDPISLDLAKNNLLHPLLWVVEPMVMGHEPHASLACHIHEMVEKIAERWVDLSDNDRRRELLQVVLDQYFSPQDVETVWQCYRQKSNKLPDGLAPKRSHGDVVLKAPWGNLTAEFRGPDAWPAGSQPEDIKANIDLGIDLQMAATTSLIAETFWAIERRLQQ